MTGYTWPLSVMDRTAQREHCSRREMQRICGLTTAEEEIRGSVDDRFLVCPFELWMSQHRLS